METQNFEIWITIIVAIYGAFLSTFNYLESRKRILFKFTWGYVTNNDHQLFFFDISNIGTTLIKISRIGVKVKHSKIKGNQILPPNYIFPQILKAEDNISVPFIANDFKETLIKLGLKNTVEVKAILWNFDKIYESENWMKIDLNQFD